jgi:hypothetical protein
MLHYVTRQKTTFDNIKVSVTDVSCGKGKFM